MIRLPSASWGDATVRWITVALLVAASVAKSYQVVAEPDPHLGTWPVPAWFIAAVVACEICLSWWLVSGTAQRTSLRVAAGTFGLFACWTAAQAWARQASCGCFGPVPVPPEIMLGVDLVVGLALWRASCRCVPCAEQRWRSIITGHVVILAAMGTMLLVRPLVLGASMPPEPTQGSTALAVGRPAGWRYLPGMVTGVNDTRLTTGRWQILCYRYQCPHCQAHMESWAARARTAATAGERWGFLWLDAPGSAPDLLTDHMAGDLPRWQRTMPMMRTPALLTVVNGVVTDVGDLISAGAMSGHLP